MINSHIKTIRDLLKNNNYSTSIKIYLSYRSYSDDYDPETNNYTKSLLNPLVLKGYVKELSLESIAWKTYGIVNIGSKEVLCESKYKTWFENAAKIEINNEEYEIYKDGKRCMIQERPCNLIRVILQKVG